MTQTADSPLMALRGRMHAEVIGTGDPAYDDSRRVWNAGVDRRPSMITRRESAYGEKFDKLVRLKAAHDPGNLFRGTVNIAPSTP